MKHLLILMLTAITYTAGAQTVTIVTFIDHSNERTLQFEVSKEVNIRYYLLEGSNDNADYEMVVRIDSKGNSVLSRKYSIPVSGSDHKYYRLRQVDMNNNCFYTSIDNEMIIPEPGFTPVHADDIVSTKR